LNGTHQRLACADKIQWLVWKWIQRKLSIR
jgi:hypothetical protein